MDDLEKVIEEFKALRDAIPPVAGSGARQAMEKLPDSVKGLQVTLPSDVVFMLLLDEMEYLQASERCKACGHLDKLHYACDGDYGCEICQLDCRRFLPR